MSEEQDLDRDCQASVESQDDHKQDAGGFGVGCRNDWVSRAQSVSILEIHMCNPM
jgi:hypothetical protein